MGVLQRKAPEPLRPACHPWGTLSRSCLRRAPAEEVGEPSAPPHSCCCTKGGWASGLKSERPGPYRGRAALHTMATCEHRCGNNACTQAQ